MKKYKYHLRRMGIRSSGFIYLILIVILLILFSVLMFKGCNAVIRENFSQAAKSTVTIVGKAAFETFVPSGAYMTEMENYQYKGKSDYTATFLAALYPSYGYIDSIYVEHTGGDNIVGSPHSGESTSSGEYVTDPVSQETEPPTQPPTTEPDSQQETTTDGNNNGPDIMSVAGKVYSKEDLLNRDFLLKNIYIVPSHTSLTSNILKPEQLLNTNLTMEKDATKPQILIFHTHSQEKFKDSTGTDMSIVQVGDYLDKLLTEKYGYNVIHDRNSYDLINGVLDRSAAYTYANEAIEKTLAENPSIQVVIDLHRDGVAEDRHLITEQNGVVMAQLMLFNGISYTNNLGEIDYLKNPYRSDNLAMSLQMFLLGKTYYPGYFRCIYIEGYRYCLHWRGRSMLVEAGAQTNTYQEVINAMDPLADLLNMELSGNYVK